MKISQKAWNNYITKMSAISSTAARKMQEYAARHGFDDMKAIVEYAKALSDHYGEAIGALACQMYDATAAAQGAIVPEAEIAELPEYGDVAKAVYGAKKTSESEVYRAIGRLVKQVGADTTLKNAQRDGAQFAWVPSGDTCAFCITLASRGWQYMSRKALRNGHAEHIHANCDCQYAIRFNTSSGVAGYNPDEYKEMYNNAEGSSSQAKINAMRREHYAENKEKINAQKRAAYAEKSERTLQRQLRFEYNGKEEFIPKGTIIESKRVIAGKGSSASLRDTKRLENIYHASEDEWKKCVGKITSEKYIFDIHWYESDDGTIYEEKIKNMREKK